MPHFSASLEEHGPDQLLPLAAATGGTKKMGKKTHTVLDVPQLIAAAAITSPLQTSITTIACDLHPYSAGDIPPSTSDINLVGL
jgi:hypothetical protein